MLLMVLQNSGFVGTDKSKSRVFDTRQYERDQFTNIRVQFVFNTSSYMLLSEFVLFPNCLFFTQVDFR